MRKTKAAAGIGTDSARSKTEAGASVVEEKVIEEKVIEEKVIEEKVIEEKAEETVVEAKAAKPTAQSIKRNVTSSQPAQVSVDSYQSGRRVWPD
jgi:hypothetical protein